MTTETVNVLHAAHSLLEELDHEGHTLPDRAYQLIDEIRQHAGCCPADDDQ